MMHQMTVDEQIMWAEEPWQVLPYLRSYYVVRNMLTQLDTIITSDQGRARQTAGDLNAGHLTVDDYGYIVRPISKEGCS